MECQIGLWNQSFSQESLIWMDGTEYNWGQINTNTSQWKDGITFSRNFDCVKLSNKPAQQHWTQYDCFTNHVSCGVCNTPNKRSYVFNIIGTITQIFDGSSGLESPNTTYFMILTGSDIFNNSKNSMVIERTITSNDGPNLFNYTSLIKNVDNIGPINTLSIVTKGAVEITVGMLFWNIS